MAIYPPLVWLDLEMTGLELQTDVIIELAIIVTNNELQPLHEGLNLVIHQSKHKMDSMGPWCTKHHEASGLTKRVLQSELSLAQAEKQALQYLTSLGVSPGVSPLCGNSIGTDRAFLALGMPLLNAHLHYRNVDVSSIKELAFRWKKDLPAFTKNNSHRALDDIIESIEELRYYQTHLFAL